MKKVYEKPLAEVMDFKAEDIIRTSGLGEAGAKSVGNTLITTVEGDYLKLN